MLQVPYYPLEHSIWFMAVATHGFDGVGAEPTSIWSFGDGNSSLGTIATNQSYTLYNYLNPGAYTVTLNVSNQCNKVFLQTISQYNTTGGIIDTSNIFIQR